MIVFANLGLTNIEKQLLTNYFRNETDISECDLTSSSLLSWRHFRSVFTDWRLYLFGLIGFGNGCVILSLTTLLPKVMESMGYSKSAASLMIAPPYIAACTCCLLLSYLASRRNEHGNHVAFSSLIALSGCILMLPLFDKGKIAIYASVTVIFAGVFSTFALLISWLTKNVSSHATRAMAISFVVGIGEMSGIMTPLVRLLPMITS